MLPTFVLQASIALQPIVEIKAHPYDRKVFQRLAVDLRGILTYKLGTSAIGPGKTEWQYE